MNPLLTKRAVTMNKEKQKSSYIRLLMKSVRILFNSSRIVEVSTLREALINEATKQNVNLTEATKKNLLRNILSQCDNFKSLTYNHNRVLIFPTTLQVEDLVVSNYEMHQELTSLKSLSTNEIETD